MPGRRVHTRVIKEILKFKLEEVLDRQIAVARGAKKYIVVGKQPISLDSEHETRCLLR